ncbi:MAG: SDR family NAD(P)-dependent oxidoreductase [Anaerolineales bacterium]
MAGVLVTGGAGFIGSHLAQALVECGDKVRVLDNFSTGSAKNLAGLETQIELIRGDLRNSDDVRKAVQDIETIFHQAAFISVPKSIEKPLDCYAVNVTGTIELLEAARLAGVGRVILASSAAVYGSGEESPLREDSRLDCLSPYAASKRFNEILAELYSQVYGLPVIALRYFNVYGPRQSPTSAYAAVIPKFIQRLKSGQAPVIFGDGRQTRDFIYVGDVVRANLLAAGAESLTASVFNVCSGEETSLLDLVDVLYGLAPLAPKPQFAATRPGDVPRSLGDPNLAASQLGFKTSIPLDVGLKHCVDEWAA